ncbi:zf-HC2 domain-containing protein [Nonomuraea rubra]|uniref:zf-HC2 domain-containing protein n=1 Tax=Nonomuraea rubra TaxID=46180 RepID=UPI003CD098F7
MTCEEVRISLGAHALGALDPEEAAEIDHHLATCEACGARAAGAGGSRRVPGQGVGARRGAGGQPSAPGARPAAERPRQRTRRGPRPDVPGRGAAVLVVGGTVWTAIQTGSGSETRRRHRRHRARRCAGCPRSCGDQGYETLPHARECARSKTARKTLPQSARTRVGLLPEEPAARGAPAPRIERHGRPDPAHHEARQGATGRRFPAPQRPLTHTREQGGSE